MERSDNVVDLGRVARGLAKLDRIAQDHPELVSLGLRGPANQAAWERELAGGESVGRTEQTAFRLPVELLERIDHIANLATVESGGLARITRTDVVRVLVSRALASIEAEVGSAPTRTPRGGK